MQNITFKNLSLIGYSNYNLFENGELYKIIPSQQIKISKQKSYKIINDKGETKIISQKKIYRQVFNKEFCIDNIENLPFEKWKCIKGTNGKYFVSNFGRIKSYCKYNSIILKQCKSKKGYLYVKINGKNIYIHKLVANAFCVKLNKVKCEIHHKDFNKINNCAKNLQFLSVEGHHKIHNLRNGKKQ